MTSAPATAEKSAAQGIGADNQTVAANLPAQVPSRQEKNPIASGGRVAAIVPQTYEDVWRLAGAIAASKMAPKAYKVDPRAEASPFSQEKITVGIMHGMEVGFTPMASLQSIAVINGMPSIWGDGMLALVKSSGLLEEIREWIEGDGTGLVAHCWVLRRGQKNPTEQTFSMAEAAKAGLMSKEGPWKTYTRRMLQMRARSWALRDEFPDVLRGLVSAEEAIDMGVLTDDGSGTYASDRPTPPPAPTRAAIAATVEAEKIIEQDLGRGSDRMPDTPQETGDEPEEGQPDLLNQNAAAFRWVNGDGVVQEIEKPSEWIDAAVAGMNIHSSAGGSVKSLWAHNAEEWKRVQAAMPATKKATEAKDRLHIRLDELIQAEKDRGK